MEAAELSTERFWHSPKNHIAVNPLRPGESEGLAEFAAKDIGAKGWCFFQTSGSEGRPKWAGLEKRAFLISADAVNRHFGLGSGDRWLIALPLHHVGGFSITARCFAAGSSAVQMRGKWDAASFASLCMKSAAAAVSLVPAQLHDLVQQRIPCPAPLRAAIIGGGVLPPSLRDQARGLGWPVFATYGMTEAASQVASESAECSELQVLPHWSAAVDDAGVLALRGDALAKGYAIRDAAGSWSWQPIDPAAGLRTRDRVRLRQEGSRCFLQFLGRESAFVKVLGELVNLDALQARLDAAADQLGSQARPLIVAVPHERQESALLAVTDADLPDDAAARLLAAFNASSLPFEQIARIRRIAAIPRSALGKVEMAKLLEMLE